jgi:hypothetical protein
LLLALVWALGQILLAVGVIAGTTVSACVAATAGALRLRLGSILRFGRKEFVRCLLMLMASLLLALIVINFFGWVNDHTLEVASFLTFRVEKPVSPITIEKIFWTIEALIWIVVVGFLLSFLIILVRAGWRAAWQQAARTLANSCWRAAFLTSLLSAVLFGGLSYLLLGWHPQVTPGLWDYAQLILRTGLALMLLVSGFLFLLLSLARLTPSSAESPPS